MRQPTSSEQYITVIDNQGRAKIQYVESIVQDVRGEQIYVTTDSLKYTKDSLEAKQQDYLLSELDRLSSILTHPDLVIWDPVDQVDETLIYYKQVYIAQLQEAKIVAAIVKIRGGIKFFYNLYVQESGKVKGLAVVTPAEIKVWYIASQAKRRQFGL